MSTAHTGPAAPPAARAMRRLQLLAWLVMAGLALFAVLSVVGIWSDISDHNLIRRLMSGEFVSPRTANSADHRVQTLSRAEIGVYFATGALFIAWFRHAYKNVARLGVAGMRWSARWAVGGWFVPVLNLARPKQILNDIWQGSDPALRIGGTLSRDNPPFLYQVWWGAWILGWIGDRLTYTTFNNAKTLPALSNATLALTASDAVDLIGAVIAIAVVYSLTTRQQTRADALAAIDPVDAPAGI